MESKPLISEICDLCQESKSLILPIDQEPDPLVLLLKDLDCSDCSLGLREALLQLSWQAFTEYHRN